MCKRRAHCATQTSTHTSTQHIVCMCMAYTIIPQAYTTMLMGLHTCAKCMSCCWLCICSLRKVTYTQIRIHSHTHERRVAIVKCNVQTIIHAYSHTNICSDQLRQQAAKLKWQPLRAHDSQRFASHAFSDGADNMGDSHFAIIMLLANLLVRDRMKQGRGFNVAIDFLDHKCSERRHIHIVRYCEQCAMPSQADYFSRNVCFVFHST